LSSSDGGVIDMVRVRSHIRSKKINAARIAAIARAVYAAMGARNYSLDIAIIGDRAMRRLNQRFRRKDRTTDVLSFGASLSGGVAGGDIAISLPAAGRNSRAIGHSLDRELCFLIVHGILHILGYDHEQPKDEKVMLRKQRTIIRRLAAQRLEPKRGGLVRPR
jgi:probable rRNA maturation factor